MFGLSRFDVLDKSTKVVGIVQNVDVAKTRYLHLIHENGNVMVHDLIAVVSLTIAQTLYNTHAVTFHQALVV
jgi:predicted transcriptional regulator